MGAKPTGQLTYPLDRGVPSLADDIRRAEPARHGNAVRVAAEHDDLLRAETTRGNDPAETNRAVTNDRGDLARAYVRPQRRVMAGTHYVGERQKRRHERVIRANRKRDQSSVRLRYTHCFALAAV
jgi:hypothetical protein